MSTFVTFHLHAIIHGEFGCCCKSVRQNKENWATFLTFYNFSRNKGSHDVKQQHAQTDNDILETSLSYYNVKVNNSPLIHVRFVSNHQS